MNGLNRNDIEQISLLREDFPIRQSSCKLVVSELSAKSGKGAKAMNTEQYIQRRREDMELHRLAESTQGNYERAIRSFLKQTGRRVEELNEQDIRAYSLSLVKQGLQASTFNVH
ncbi:phage integrase N-terminal SAM-like domain-containing protein [Acutalibacter muris]|uniref:Phage integrase N-terminal SAM-like domain-containing protein n=1 Tax=Acutalibacter muris TaxID=1796620 RepID=A0A1Z2XPA0_9FIRM|nr:phage integrase N-terminal SAM-like domain-containing protein [Acutalibacter muris]ANU53050.1 hypothetical protein A4V00_02870 [Hungateiclostridiaceae bacterium KB18]ASB40275.1 hypothetical protein ADH66_06150 [Acutalibacter muris]QQR29565.1 phage integrase N-terminal SAM-like domain-containing protein [Acutalibacter muris]